MHCPVVIVTGMLAQPARTLRTKTKAVKTLHLLHREHPAVTVLAAMAGVLCLMWTETDHLAHTAHH